jgi:hypothetical protein
MMMIARVVDVSAVGGQGWDMRPPFAASHLSVQYEMSHCMYIHSIVCTGIMIIAVYFFILSLFYPTPCVPTYSTT